MFFMFVIYTNKKLPEWMLWFVETEVALMSQEEMNMEFA